MSNKIIKYTKNRLPRESLASDPDYKAYNKYLDRTESLLQGKDKACRTVANKLHVKIRRREVEIAQRDKRIAERDAKIAERDEWIHELLAERAEMRQRVKDFTDELRQKTRVTSRNSNKPPSKDSHYHTVDIDKMAERHGLGDIINESPEDDEPVDETETQDDTEGAASSTDDADAQKAEEQAATAEPKQEESEPKKKKARHPGASQKLRPCTKPPIECHPIVCPHCGCQEFHDVHAKRTHQFIDLVNRLVEVLHFIVFEGTCANCGALVMGKVPKEFMAHFGPGFHALLAWLNTEGGVTRRHLEAFSWDFLNVPISQGCIQNILRRASLAIESLYNMIGKGAREYWYNHMDETSSPTFGPMGKHVHWMWVMCNESFAFFKIDEHRSKEAFLVVIGPWRGVLISDDYGTYIKWENGRQTCLAHLKRAAKKVSECRERKVAECGRWLHKTIVDLCKQKGKKLEASEIEKIKTDFITRAQEYKGIGGQAATLIERMIAEFDAVTYFLSLPIEPTNNFAEQMIRPYVVARKNSFGTTSECGERWLERSLSLRMTCKLRDESYASVLRDALQKYSEGKLVDTSWLDSCVYKGA